MIPRPRAKKAVAAGLSLCLWALSAGPACWQALAAQVALGRAPVVAPTLGYKTGAFISSPAFNKPFSLSLPVAPGLKGPTLAAAPEISPFALSLSRLELPLAYDASAGASVSSLKDGVARDFALRLGESGLEVSGVPGSQPDTVRKEGLKKTGSSQKVLSKLPPPSRRELRQHRSSLFPLVVSGLSAAVGAVFKAGAWLVPAVQGGAFFETARAALDGVGLGALVAAGAFLVAAAVGVLTHVVAMRRGAGVSDAEFRDFVRAEAAAGRLDAGAAGLIKPHRPESRFDLDFGFTAGGGIYLRPELVKSPLLFRQVLLHELHHYETNRVRGPPRRGFFRYLASELGARLRELRGPRALKKIRVPVLERVLREAKMSLKHSHSYDVLVLNGTSGDLKDPLVYRDLSGGLARVEIMETQKPEQVLGEAKNRGRFRAVVLDKPFSVLPDEGSTQGKRLALTLRKLDSLFVLATRLLPLGDGGFSGSSDLRRYHELTETASRLDRSDPKALAAFEDLVKRFWREVAAQRLKGLPLTAAIENLYASLQNHGLAFLTFAPGDRGLAAWEKLLRCWEAEDGGAFRATRVDLENGGHIIVLRKIESRVALFLKPLGHGVIEKSVINPSNEHTVVKATREALVAAGYAEHLAKFDSLGVEVYALFGQDVGRQQIFITIPRRNVPRIQDLVAGASIQVESSETGFLPLLDEAVELHKVRRVHGLRLRGAGGRIAHMDTGADVEHADYGGRVEIADLVNEGPEDWMGHGSHVSGIAGSQDAVYTGMAPEALILMSKVFSREGPGTSDGVIRAGAAKAMQWGADVINASLGSKGASDSPLSQDFSELTRHKNAKGRFPVVLASGGNSGPSDRTMSQPAAGKDVIAVAAAAVGEKGGPEMAFYSSVGPDVVMTSVGPRLTLKPDITGKGGDVTTTLGSVNAYVKSVISTKSSRAQKAASDTKDGKHTGMSGTSMASPVVAGIALLVILALRTFKKDTAFLEERLPLAVRAILMRTAADMKVPVWHQGAGFVDALAAVKLVGVSWLRKVARWFGRPAAAAPGEWDWIEDYKAVLDLEDSVYARVELAKSEALARLEDGASQEEPEDAQNLGNAVYAEVSKKFAATRDEALPALLAALKHPVWLVRRQAALALLNLKASAAVKDLAAAAMNDEDARVRQMAFLALAEIPSHAVDILLKNAASDPRWDVGVYAAYALARRGDRAGVGRILAELSNPDEAARFTAAWLLGQLGVRATALEAESLSARVRDEAERGNVRHLAVASLTNLASARIEVIGDQVVKDLLSASGPQNLALTRTVAKFFPAALHNRAFVDRLRAEPLRAAVAGFVLQNKAAVGRPGALGEMVALLARVINLSLEQPTRAPDPDGAGVQGVDPLLGPLDLLLEPPLDRGIAAFWDGSSDGPGVVYEQTGLEPELLARHGAVLKAALPLSGILWVSVPEAERFALRAALESRGWKVRNSRAKYTVSRRLGTTAASEAGLSLPLGAEVAALPEGADLSVVSLEAEAGVSEASVLAALEALRARVGDALAKPVIAVIALGGSATPGRMEEDEAKALDRLWTRLLERLALDNIGLVMAAGNEGPALGTVSEAGAGLAVVVAAAGRTEGLAPYSSRGTPESPSISWTEVVDDLEPGLPSLAESAALAARALLGLAQGKPPVVQTPARELGTGVAARRAAEKLARLAAALIAKTGRLPDGWFFYLAGVVKQSLKALPDRQPHEVGAGLFEDESAALEILNTRLLDPDEAERAARSLAEAAREKRAPETRRPAPSFWKRIWSAVRGALHPRLPLSGVPEKLVKSWPVDKR